MTQKKLPLSLQFDKGVLVVEGSEVKCSSTYYRTTKSLLDVLPYYELPLIISVQWSVFVSDTTPTLEQQNKKFLRRAKKIADCLGREVKAFDQLNGVIYGCVLV